MTECPDRDCRDCLIKTKSKVDNINAENETQWVYIKDLDEKMRKMSDKWDERHAQILTRINITLGSVAATCVMLALNIILKIKGN